MQGEEDQVAGHHKPLRSDVSMYPRDDVEEGKRAHDETLISCTHTNQGHCGSNTAKETSDQYGRTESLLIIGNVPCN